MEKEFNKFERARILGARALQISMGAPILVKHKDIYNPIDIAKKELKNKVIPITVRKVRKESKHYISTDNKKEEDMNESSSDKGKESS